MSVTSDLVSIRDLIVSHGTEADKRAWERIKEELDWLNDKGYRLESENNRLRSERDSARAELAAERGRRPASGPARR